MLTLLSRQSILLAINRLLLALRWRRIVVFIAELQVIRFAEPDDGLRHGVNPVVVLTVGELSTFANDWAGPRTIDVPHTALLEWNFCCMRPTHLRAIGQHGLDG